MRFFIVRHGETHWNAEGRFQGQKDTELNERGLEQSRLVAGRLAGHAFEAVVSGPLKRALYAAREIAESCGVESVEVIPGLTEINHGDWEGLSSGEVETRWPGMLEKWRSSPHTSVMPGVGGESLRSVQIRAAAEA